MIDDLAVEHARDRSPSADTSARWRLVCLLTLGAFLVLGLAAFASGTLPGDVSVRQDLLMEDHAPLKLVARVVNYGGKWQVLLPASILLFALSAAARRHWWLWPALLIGSALVEHAFKIVIGRPRPSGASLGFPSGHTTAATVFAVALIYLLGREQLHPVMRLAIQVGALAGMFAVGWARVVLHAHWPTDVLGGFLLGTCCVASAAWWETAREDAIT